MKSLGPAAVTAAPAGKRRWRCVAATGAALALVFFSVVVPFAVLLGLHTRFPSSPYLTPPPKTLPFFYTLACRSLPGSRHSVQFAGASTISGHLKSSTGYPLFLP